MTTPTPDTIPLPTTSPVLLPDPLGKGWTTYGQLGQDIVLCEYLRACEFATNPGVFVDLGAYDGVTFSNTRFLQLAGWQGVLVEASPRSLAELLDRTGCLPNCHVVGAVLVPHGHEGGLIEWHDAPLVGSVHPAHVAKWKAQQAFRTLHLPTIGVPTLARHLNDTGYTQPTVLSCDLEGLTTAVLATLLPCIGAPRIAVAEIDHEQPGGMEALVQVFRDNGMRHAATIEWDAFFVRDSDPWAGPSPEAREAAVRHYRKGCDSEANHNAAKKK